MNRLASLPRFRRAPLSIRSRLLLLVLAVWLPAAAGFGLLARSMYAREETAARQNLQNLAQSLTFAVEREVEGRFVLARTLAATNAVQDGDIKRFHAVASRATAGTPNWAVLVTATTRLADTRESVDWLPERRRRDAPPIVDGEPEVVFMTNSQTAATPAIVVFASPHGGKAADWNVGVAFDPSVIQQVLAKHTLPEGAGAVVLDAEHKIIARSRDPLKWLGKAASSVVTARVSAGYTGFANIVTLDGVPSLAYITSNDSHHWGYSVALPEASLHAAARRVTLQALAAASLLLIVGLAIAAYAAGHIRRPILALRDAAAELGLDRIPPILTTGVSETDAVSKALHEAGLRSAEATALLERRVTLAVRSAEVAQAKLFEGQKHEVIGRLTGGLAHDFNNLLQTISMGLHVLGKAAPEGRPQRVAQAATQACAKAASLVRQMLTFGRAQPMQPQSIELQDFALRTRELAGKAVGERVKLEIQIDAGLSAAFADPVQFELALLNLIFNARDSMADRPGTIRVLGRTPTSVDLMPDFIDAPGDFVCLEVIDDGMGMDAETLARALEPYFTTKPLGLGTGLGLAQVDGFARQSGGALRIRSSAREGTRITMLLPAARHADPTPTVKLEHEVHDTHRALDILMVEDDALVSSVVAPALEALGHRVVLHETADAAVGAFDGAVHFDVLFTDIVMPGRMSGLDLVAWCQEHQPSLPVLVTTGYTAEQIDPALRVLRKPYGMDAVAQALQDVVPLVAVPT